ncbi:hypothetical protein ACFQY4_36815 [Catellatospora bangladeshensis]|uniref:hypothetical protein n=1 Tax=Catellatospora bangladeshensis TaxID=310355 RepID=UPI003618FE5D
MADILPALLKAIRDTGSPSRVIITSRYRFPAPAATTVVVEALETLTTVEQIKKITNLRNLRPGSHLDLSIRQRAIEAAAGNPACSTGSTGSSPMPPSTSTACSPPSRTWRTSSGGRPSSPRTS